MNKETITKLLQSPYLSDIFIAISLAYNLSFEEFDSIFDNYMKLKTLPDECYYFTRNNKIYYLGNAYLGRVPSDASNLEEFMKKGSNVDEYKDLTPNI